MVELAHLVASRSTRYWLLGVPQPEEQKSRSSVDPEPRVEWPLTQSIRVAPVSVSASRDTTPQRKDAFPLDVVWKKNGFWEGLIGRFIIAKENCSRPMRKGILCE
jgi:hypothetical protein